jgi:hypothetical protein
MYRRRRIATRRPDSVVSEQGRQERRTRERRENTTATNRARIKGVLGKLAMHYWRYSTQGVDTVTSHPEGIQNPIRTARIIPFHRFFFFYYRRKTGTGMYNHRD